MPPPIRSFALAAAAVLLPQIAVAQGGALCSYTLGPDLAASAAGGPSQIPLTASGGCQWSAVSQAPWITLTGTSSGTGSGLIPISVAANTGATARIGTVLAGGRTFAVTQAGQGCTYALTPASATPPAGGGSETVSISAPAGCSWTAVSQASWLSLSAQPSGLGNGSVQVIAAANTSGLTRAGTVLIAGKLFTVTQPAQAIACTVSPGAPPLVRSQGLTELLGDLLVQCTGTVPAGGAELDITTTLNTTVTSRLLPGVTGDTEALLLVDDPASPVLGSTAFRGRLAGYNVLRWTGITLPAGTVSRTFRIVNLRGNASLVSTTVSPAMVTGLVEVKSSRLVTVTNATQTLAMIGEGLTASAGQVGVGPALDTFAIPVTYNEGIATAFRIKVGPSQSPSQPGVAYNTESGFINSTLGSTVGVADTGTRLRLLLSNIPVGVRVYAPLRPVAGSGAQLLGEDAFLGVGSHFGGAYQELTVTTGSTLALWEIDAANPIALESRVFSIAFSNATQQQVEQIRASLSATIAPLSGSQQATTSTVPRFFDPLAPRGTRVNLRLTAGPVTQIAVSALPRPKAIERLVVVGNYGFSYQVQNDSTDTATQVTVRGNLPPGFTIPSCSATGGQCTTSGNEFTAVVPTLAPGATSTVSLTGGSTADLEPGFFIESTATATAAELDADLASNRASSGVTVESCPPLTSASATIPAAGGTFTINVPACSLWTATTETAWLAITNGASGSGAGQVTYTVESNPGDGRTGFISVAGQTFVVNQQASGTPPPCTFTLAPGSANVTSSGVYTTFALTASAPNCAWTASSNATWAQIFPLSGTGSSTMYYRVFPNFNTTPRAATITAGGQPFPIQQAANTGTRMQRVVQLAYFSFLGRVPSTFELNHHVNSGLPEATIIRNFWVSDEFAFGGRLIAGLYVGLLERDAEYGGWQFQRLALADGGVTQVDLSRNFLNSAEYVTRNGAQTDAAFVTFLYMRVLGRTPSPSEVAAQVAVLQGGVSRAQMAASFLSGAEFRGKTTARLDSFLLYGAVLLRDGSPGERQFILNQLAGGTAIDTLIAGFTGSAEFNRLLQ